CEIAFYKNQMELAKHHAHNAILTAREKKQYLIESVAEQYLLRIASQEGNYPLVKEILKRLRIHLNNPDFWCRQLFYDIYTGYFYAKIGLPEMVPPWLAADEKAETSEIRIPTRELIINVTYHIACKNFNQALIVLAASYPREPQERFLFGELTLTLLFAVAKVKTGDAPGAVSAFEKAYKMSFDGVFEMFFIGLGKNLHPLVVAASSEPGCYIPGEWLKMIDRKASIYAKKANIILNSVKKEKNIKDAVSLSDREHEVLNDLYHGLSRDEIAENRYLSVNTVKKILQSIYIKLNANNNVDTIRIAIEKKLVG
ncbi:MAG: LuxR C-terminal-related transcriptional regulator, partial [Oscillospiraceae bacterium]|nr:LuxR C-terminal-related transcriptional regulator [Oscillospiraceae bacterium]